MWLARRGPEPSPMSLNDRAADRQAHTHSLRLGRVKGFEQAWEALRRQPRPGIPHGDAHAFRLVGFRADLQFAPAVTVAAHCFRYRRSSWGKQKDDERQGAFLP